MITEELQQQIESLRGNTSKMACNTLNEIRRGLDGTFLTTCFCGSVVRINFLNDFFRFYDNLNLNS